VFLLINPLNTGKFALSSPIALTLPAVKELIRLETGFFLGEQVALDTKRDDKFTTIYY